MKTIQPADPIARRKAIWTVIVATVIGAVALSLVSNYRSDLETWLLSEPHRLGDKLNLLLATLAVASLPLVIIAIYMWRTGVVTLSAERFPPPGLRVIRDTPIVRGARARWRARMLQLGAALTVLLVFVGVLGTWWVVRSLIGS